jgi:putative glutamine amidotransferase
VAPRPRIGIVAANERARWSVWDREVYLTPRSYVERVQQAGGLALLLPADPAATEDAEPWFEVLHGVILAGGADIHPAAYGAARDPHTVETRPERDAFEIALARGALERDLPLLGICRGMQLLNVALGGTLIQHLPDEVGHGNHRRMLGGFDNADHDVLLAEGSLAARAAGETRHFTLSHHHQGVAELGEGLAVTGWADLDDLPEAIEVPDASYALGVQWHPEADPRSSVVASLVEAAARVSVG